MTVSAPKPPLPPPLSFRPATPGDVPALLRLIRSAYRGESSRRGWTTEADLVADLRIDEAGLLAKIRDPDGVVFVVTEDVAPTVAIEGIDDDDADDDNDDDDDDNEDAPTTKTTAKATTTTATASTTETDATTPVLSCCELLLRRRRRGDDNDNDDGHDSAAAATAYFGLFAVDPARQAAGVGRRVLEHAEAFARGRWGARRVELCVIWPRGELIRWYERRGYARTGETRAFPYGELVGGPALRGDLYFVVLEKRL